jgi:hypothetical protein
MLESGLMTLVCVHPETENAVVCNRFMIGDVDNMVATAIDYATSGHNVYVEARTVRPGLRGRERGGKADTIAVFAWVRDNDNDKGKGGTNAIATSMAVESSPGNSHDWVFSPPGITVQEADAIGQGMRAATGGDSDTGVITQPYRVAGTPNYPGPTKRARGRTVSPTKILKSGGAVWTKEQLLAAFPAPKQKERASSGPSERTGKVDETVEEMIARPGKGGRGRVLYHACKAARLAGMTPDDLEHLMRRYPNGCADKFLEPYDRLRKEIDRAWGKLEDRAQADPTYPEVDTVDAKTARKELRRLFDRFLEVATAPKPETRLFDFNEPKQVIHAVRAMTGLGKTRIAAECIADHIKTGKLEGPVGTPSRRID